MRRQQLDQEYQRQLDRAQRNQDQIIEQQRELQLRRDQQLFGR
jgi:hypothetical protein